MQLKFILLFVPAAYATYLFHEFGHWIIGEILGNDMAFSLNYVWPKSGFYNAARDAVYVSIGGPAFTILQSLIGLLIVSKHKNRYIYPFLFFPVFNRFFSLLFGGFSKQDEAKISALLGIGTYTFAVIVLFVLVLIVIQGSTRLKIGMKENGYIVTVCTFCQLLVIGTYELIL